MIENTWAFPALEALHLIGLALLVGTITLDNLLALGMKAQPSPRWTLWTGLALIVTTGLAMFLSNIQRYRENPAFLTKMTVLAVLIVFHVEHSKRRTRTSAIMSLALWTFAVVAARAIIDFDA